jgi:hypothetical protein
MGSMAAGGSRLEWTDFLPDRAATILAGLMNAGATAMTHALEALDAREPRSGDVSK